MDFHLCLHVRARTFFVHDFILRFVPLYGVLTFLYCLVRCGGSSLASFQVALRLLISIGTQIATFPLMYLSSCPRSFEGLDPGTLSMLLDANAVAIGCLMLIFSLLCVCTYVYV